MGTFSVPLVLVLHHVLFSLSPSLGLSACAFVCCFVVLSARLHVAFRNCSVASSVLVAWALRVGCIVMYSTFGQPVWRALLFLNFLTSHVSRPAGSKAVDMSGL